MSRLFFIVSLSILIFWNCQPSIYIAKPKNRLWLKTIELRSDSGCGYTYKEIMVKGKVVQKSSKVYYYKNKKVSKRIYKKKCFVAGKTPCPIISKRYNKDTLISSAITCDGLYVGEFVNYYPNGSIQLIGQYKECPIGDCRKAIQKGIFTPQKHGIWKFYTTNNELECIQVWENNILKSEKNFDTPLDLQYK